MQKTVSFDFDGTLSKKDVQEYAIELMQKGVEVWVVTSRYDDLHKHRYPKNATNEDLWEVIDKLNIPRWKVRFTCMESKSLYFLNSKVIWHLDDDDIEIEAMRWGRLTTKGIYVNFQEWKERCESELLACV
jgi:hypothetical protein